MPQTSSAARTKRRGMTLIEVMLAVTVLSILVSVVAPNIGAWTRAQGRQSATLAVQRLAIDTRNEAVAEGVTTELRYDASERTFVGVVPANPNQRESEERELGRVKLPEGLEPEDFILSGADRAGGDWRGRFSADGTAEPGSVRLESSVLRIDARGGISRVEPKDNPPEDDTQEEWDAGAFEQRS